MLAINDYPFTYVCMYIAPAPFLTRIDGLLCPLHEWLYRSIAFIKRGTLNLTSDAKVFPPNFLQSLFAKLFTAKVW